jgi:hypothetical protein
VSHDASRCMWRPVYVSPLCFVLLSCSLVGYGCWCLSQGNTCGPPHSRACHSCTWIECVEGCRGAYGTCDCFIFCSACCNGAEGVLACGCDEVGSRVLLGFDTGRAGLSVTVG